VSRREETILGGLMFLGWIVGVAALVWIGAEIFHDAFGWFATRPTFPESMVVASWGVLVVLWLKLPSAGQS
jgi:hypothetical protein